MTAAKKALYVKRLKRLADHRAVILDLRGNPGSTDMLGQVFASCFAPFAGRVVSLVDERTFSTADNVAACLVDTRENVTVVGRHAGSGTGAPRPFTLPHSGARVTFCTMRVWTAAGRMTEGQGVEPDVAVRWKIVDWLDPMRDPDLSAALTLLR